MGGPPRPMTPILRLAVKTFLASQRAMLHLIFTMQTVYFLYGALLTTVLQHSYEMILNGTLWSERQRYNGSERSERKKEWKCASILFGGNR